MQEKNRAIRKNSEMKKSKDTEQKDKLNKKDNLNIGREDLIIGRNAVSETLKGKGTIEALYI